MTRAVHGYSFVMASLGLCALHVISGSLFHCNFEDAHTGRGSRDRGLVASEILRNPGELVIMMVTNLVH